MSCGSKESQNSIHISSDDEDAGKCFLPSTKRTSLDISPSFASSSLMTFSSSAQRLPERIIFCLDLHGSMTSHQLIMQPSFPNQFSSLSASSSLSVTGSPILPSSSASVSRLDALKQQLRIFFLTKCSPVLSTPANETHPCQHECGLVLLSSIAKWHQRLTSDAAVFLKAVDNLALPSSSSLSTGKESKRQGETIDIAGEDSSLTELDEAEKKKNAKKKKEADKKKKEDTGGEVPPLQLDSLLRLLYAELEDSSSLAMSSSSVFGPSHIIRMIFVFGRPALSDLELGGSLTAPPLPENVFLDIIYLYGGEKEETKGDSSGKSKAKKKEEEKQDDGHDEAQRVFDVLCKLDQRTLHRSFVFPVPARLEVLQLTMARLLAHGAQRGVQSKFVPLQLYVIPDSPPAGGASRKSRGKQEASGIDFSPSQSYSSPGSPSNSSLSPFSAAKQVPNSHASSSSSSSSRSLPPLPLPAALTGMASDILSSASRLANHPFPPHHISAPPSFSSPGLSFRTLGSTFSSSPSPVCSARKSNMKKGI